MSDRYSVSGREDYADNNQIFIGIKLDNEYRYFVLVNLVDKGYLLTLVNKNHSIIDHFYRPLVKDSIENTVLSLCKDYDSFWYPELFKTYV